MNTNQEPTTPSAIRSGEPLWCADCKSYHPIDLHTDMPSAALAKKGGTAMTTQPPSPEAVEAAIAYAAMNHRVDAMSEDVLRILWANVKPDCAGYSSAYALTAARILAAEVERLRAELERRHKEYASALNRRVDVENTLAMVAAGKRDLLTREECRELAVKLGVSPATPITNKP